MLPRSLWLPLWGLVCIRYPSEKRKVCTHHTSIRHQWSIQSGRKKKKNTGDISSEFLSSKQHEVIGFSMRNLPNHKATRGHQFKVVLMRTLKHCGGLHGGPWWAFWFKVRKSIFPGKITTNPFMRLPAGQHWDAPKCCARNVSAN